MKRQEKKQICDCVSASFLDSLVELKLTVSCLTVFPMPTAWGVFIIAQSYDLCGDVD